MEFSSESGAVLPCSARGQPLPRITWEKKDGSPAALVSDFCLRSHLERNEVFFLFFFSYSRLIKICVWQRFAWSRLSLLRWSQVDGLRSVRSDGSLVLSAFPPSRYRQDVHSATYRCVASSPLGTVKSRLVHVQGGE
ncbi:unnamed protein product, partial [Ixodes hexagonus]